MKIYNPFKREEYTKKFSNFWLERLYETVESKRDYEVYVDDQNNLSEIAYVIKDEILGNKLFSIIQEIKNYGKIALKYSEFRIRKTVIDPKSERIFAFYVEIYLNDPNHHLNIIEKLIDVITFINKLSEFNFGLTSYFYADNTKADDFFEVIFSLNKFDDMTQDEINKKNLSFLVESTYQRINKVTLNRVFSKDNIEYEICKMNHSFDMFRMFYYYSIGKDINILNVLESENKKNQNFKCITSYPYNCDIKACLDTDLCLRKYYSYILPTMDFVENDFKKYEETGKYTIFLSSSCGYKIFKEPNESDLEGVKQLYYIGTIREYLKFNIMGILYDLNANFIGYKFEAHNIDVDKTKTILSYVFENPYDMITTLWELKKFLFSIKSACTEEQVNVDHEFNIEKDIVFNGIHSDRCFDFVSDDALLSVLNIDVEKLKEELVDIALKLYSNYIKKCYKNLDRNSFFKNSCIKFLPPKFSKGLFKYINNKSVDKTDVYYSFFMDFYENHSGSKDNLYYSKFMYNPNDVDYVLEYEISEKFGCTYERDKKVDLADGRTLYFFERTKSDSSAFLEKIDRNISVIEKVFKKEMSDVNILGISNVIYSTKIASNGSYLMIGYVSDKNIGTPLSKFDFSKITNKDFVYLALKVFTHFYDNYIDLDQIRIDEHFNAYINVVEGKLNVYKVGNESFALQFLKKLEEGHIVINGMDFENAKRIDFYDKNRLVKMYESMTSFCDIHKTYYSSNLSLCPICDKTLFDVEKYNGEYGDIEFEDRYAKHYRLNDELNLKIYNEEIVDLCEVEKCIDMMLIPMCHENAKYYMQNLFLPYKKAIILSNRKFIGYVYRRVNFKECKDFRENFTNKKKLKSLIAFLRQVRSLFDRGLDFLYDPYDNLLYNSDYKQIIQIVNIDLLKVGDKKLHKANEKMLINYIVDSLSNEIGMDEIFAHSLDELESKLVTLLNNMTKICTVHNIFYHKKYMFCPLCLPNFNPNSIKENSIYSAVDDWAKKENIKAEGGESTIYEYSDNIYAKIFLEEVSVELKLKIIMKIFERKNLLKELNKKYNNIHYILPEKLIIDTYTNSVRGYTLNKVSNSYSISLLKNKEVVEKLGFTRRDVFDILIAVGEGIEHLHKYVNIFIGDLNGENILFDKNKNVYFIDFDGMGIDDIAPLFFTDGYIDPISERNETVSKKDDWYSFAIQCFYYLTYTHPFNGIYYDEESNRNLDEVEKMEKRISLLGNHNIKLPIVAQDWKWMSKNMLNAFLDIFENESRENITPYLKEYYNDNFSQKFDIDKNVIAKKEDSKVQTFSKPKVAIREILLFEKSCKRIINSSSYISVDKNNNEVLIVVTGNGEVDVHCNNLDDVLDVKLSANEKFIFIVYKYSVVVININNNEIVYESKLNQKTTVCVNDNTFYYLNVEDGRNVIVRLKFKSNTNTLNKTIIRFHEEEYTKSFMTVNNEKFVIVKAKNNTGIIYCNDIEYKKLPGVDKVEYKVLYDVILNEWLVVNADGFYIVIKNDGENISMLDNKIAECNIDNTVFSNGNIYIPKDGAFYYINTKNSQKKEIPCSIVSKNSNIIVKSKSFVFFDDKKAYEYAKN